MEERALRPEPGRSISTNCGRIRQRVQRGQADRSGCKEYLTDWRSWSGDNAAPANFVRDFYRLLNLLGVQTSICDDPGGSARWAAWPGSRKSWPTSSTSLGGRDTSKRTAGGSSGAVRIGASISTSGSYNYLQYYALDAYEDFEGEDTFDLDTVDILTVHQAKGLEWPVVFVPSLVQGRFPSKYAGEAQEWLIPEAFFPPETRRRYEGGETEERRLFYVALTRAKDMLYLSRFRKKQNRFQPSPFLLEVAGGDPAVAATLPLPGPFVPPPDEAEEQPTISFSDLALYEGCPLRYRFSSSLGFQPQLVTELGYGRAIHHILRHVAELAKAKKRAADAY